MNVNALGTFLCSKAVIPNMKAARWGKIVTVGSSAGKTGGSMPQGVYGASKAAAMVMMKSLSRELAAYNINVNAVAPALIETDMIRGLGEFVERIPLGRVGQPADVAKVVAFLCSEGASFMTGAMVDINGGFLID
jgi:3-oxoacyl-[acyl-carrier protein] reductase